MLYVFEEISSYWDERKTVLASLCTAVAVLTSKWGGAQWLGTNAHFESLVMELRAAILGYGPDAGDDSGRVVVQPRAIAARTRSL